ncbi:hypothetical protein GCM10010307_34010 [Streptomyces vastus]|uniref:Uncharacterized protein n=1 Tax=Streptomyces vastus TaxID=285451 RepID=A0ABN3QWR2_9ACTN
MVNLVLVNSRESSAAALAGSDANVNAMTTINLAIHRYLRKIIPLIRAGRTARGCDVKGASTGLAAL